MNILNFHVFGDSLQTVYKEAARLTSLITRRGDVTPDAPSDLQDKVVDYVYTSEGGFVSQIIIPTDLTKGTERPAFYFIKSAYISFTVLVSGIVGLVANLCHSNWFFAYLVTAALLSLAYKIIMSDDASKTAESNGEPGLFGSIFIRSVFLVTPFSLYFLYKALNENPGQERNNQLMEQFNHDVQGDSQTAHGGKGAAAKYLDMHLDMVRIKQEQCRSAATDTTPIIKFGTATGKLLANGADYAPDAGRSAGLTFQDLSTHLFVAGKTGTGKTVALLKIIRACLTQTNYGMLILCGKGTLAEEVYRYILKLLSYMGSRYVLINPETTDLALFQGMTSIEVTDAIAVRDAKADAYFYGASRSLAKHSLVILEALANAKTEGFKFTPYDFRTFFNSNGKPDSKDESLRKHGVYRARAMYEVTRLKDIEGNLLVNSNGMLTSAYDFFNENWQLMQSSEKTLSSIMDQLNQWVEPIFSSEAISRWGSLEAGIDITKCLTGERFGLDVSSVKYGTAASGIVANLVRQRLYSALKKRGNKDVWGSMPEQTPVLLVMDEMHLLWSPSSNDGLDDNSMLSIARSLGLIVVAATQSLDEMISRFGKEKTMASLGNFRSSLFYESTDETNAYASSIAGPCYRPVSSMHEDPIHITGVNMKSAAMNEYYKPQNLGGSSSSLFQMANRLVYGGTGVFRKPVNSDGREQTESLSDHNLNNSHAKIIHPAVTPDELRVMLMERFSALFVGNRANCMRRDVIIIDPRVQA